MATGEWGRAAIEASIDREEELRKARPVKPSTSKPLERCRTCKQWAVADANGNCIVCHDRYRGQPNEGLAPVR